ncbi:MAG: hypothetical protein ACOH2D_16785 [Gelidibacter sp.]
MKKNYILILAILAFTQAKAQLVKEKSIDISVGYGISTPFDDIDIYGSGLYLQGEYVLSIASWIDLRPYAGLILTKSIENKRFPSEYKSNANAFLIGGKARLKAPIPWVAPYLEIGIGASVGSFETITPWTYIEESGLLMHIPLSIGLELGPKHNFDVAFTYYFHENAQQFVGALAIGFSIPLNN